MISKGLVRFATLISCVPTSNFQPPALPSPHSPFLPSTPPSTEAVALDQAKVAPAEETTSEEKLMIHLWFGFHGIVCIFGVRWDGIFFLVFWCQSSILGGASAGLQMRSSHAPKFVIETSNHFVKCSCDMLVWLIAGFIVRLKVRLIVVSIVRLIVGFIN